MTVAQLIQHLRQYPDDLRVVVSGYEGGFDDVEPERIKQINVSLDTGTDWFYGRHGMDWLHDDDAQHEYADVVAFFRTPDHEVD